MPKLLPFFLLSIGLATAASAPMPSLPGMTQADLTLNLKQFQWGRWFGQKMPSKCGKYIDTTTGGMAEICMYGSTTNIGRIVVNVIGSATLAGAVMPYVSTVPFERSNGAAAKAWVVKNLPNARVGKILEKTISGASYQLYGDPNKTVFLEIMHPKFSNWANQQSY